MIKVAIMCGHGKQRNGVWDSGTAYAGYTEAALMLPITKSAVKHLRDYGLTVISDADTNNDKNMIVDVAWANKEKVACYVSVHCDYSKAVSGVMPLYVSSSGKQLATCLNTVIKNGIPMRSRGVCKRTDLYELNATDAPACILETGAIKADLSILKNDYEKYGELIAKGICDYLGVKTEEPKEETNKDDGKLEVDGIGGELTVKASQRFFGTPVDGFISGQKASLEKYFSAWIAVRFGSGGSLMVKKMQKWVSVKEDGYLGKDTATATQKKLNSEGYNLKVDGKWGAATMKAFQDYLNTHDKAVYPKPVSTSKPTSVPTPTPVQYSSKAEKLVAKANEFCWPYGTKESKYKYNKNKSKSGKALSAYVNALKKYMKKKARISQTDCGYFVNTCVRAAGIDSSFDALPDSSGKSYPKLSSKFAIVHKGKKIPDGFLQPGDIIRYKKKSGQHTMMYYATGKIAEAQRAHAFPAIKKDTKKYNKSNVKLSTLQVLRVK